MKPFKSGAILAAWLLRLMLVWFIYKTYVQSFPGFDFKSFSFYVDACYVLFGLMLLVGGFLQKPALTVFSGLFLFILPVVQLIRSFPEKPGEAMLLYLIPLSVGFYFFTSGNDN
jgi:cell division protein FtsX